MPVQHARLSPSAADRWMHCPRSVALSELFPEEKSGAAEEGTEAHALCEYQLLLGLHSRDALDPRGTMRFWTPDMQQAAEDYAAYIMDRMKSLSENAEPLIFVEESLDLRPWIPKGMGTADAILAAGDTLIVVDFKYGHRRVPATSPQLRIYAIGAMKKLAGLLEIRRVETVIFQPRLGSVDSAVLPAEELLSWARRVLKPAARRAWRDEGSFCPGDWCRYCRARGRCKALAERNLSLAAYEFRSPDLLSPQETSDVLSRMEQLLPWVEAVKDEAVQSALEGEEFPGWQLSEGPVRRRWKNESAVAERMEILGKDPWERRLLSVAAAEKLLGRKAVQESLSDLIDRPPGKLTLVRS